jgi:hypothetical protein
VAARLLRCDDTNERLRGSQLSLDRAYAHLKQPVSVQNRHLQRLTFEVVGHADDDDPLFEEECTFEH